MNPSLVTTSRPKQRGRRALSHWLVRCTNGTPTIIHEDRPGDDLIRSFIPTCCISPMPTQPVTFFCRFCYSTNNALYPVRLYLLSLHEGLIMCANQNCAGMVDGYVDLLKLIVPISSTSQLTYEQYQQTPYYSSECDFLVTDISPEI